MADPHIKEKLDLWDKISISVYRTGIVLSGFALIALSVEQLFYPYGFKQIVLILGLGSIFQAATLHIYMKSVRTVLVAATWIAIWLLALSLTATNVWIAYFALGGFFVTHAGLALKESLCFSLFILKLIPIILVVTWFLIVFSHSEIAAACLLLVGGLYLYMGWEKIKMPLHFDLGERTKYEIQHLLFIRVFYCVRDLNIKQRNNIPF